MAGDALAVDSGDCCMRAEVTAVVAAAVASRLVAQRTLLPAGLSGSVARLCASLIGSPTSMPMPTRPCAFVMCVGDDDDDCAG